MGEGKWLEGVGERNPNEPDPAHFHLSLICQARQSEKQPEKIKYSDRLFFLFSLALAPHNNDLDYKSEGLSPHSTSRRRQVNILHGQSCVGSISGRVMYVTIGPTCLSHHHDRLFPSYDYCNKKFAMGSIKFLINERRAVKSVGYDSREGLNATCEQPPRDGGPWLEKTRDKIR